ncbi:MAG TPA: hypothetical protein VKP30_28270 [Polyangiaceae bacterium]|nr:hypothetical protein [Polyangiaceae bacterium]
MSPNICFNHNNFTANDDLHVFYDGAGKVAIGAGTAIDIQVHNNGDTSDSVQAHLYWSDPNLGAPVAFRRDIAAELAMPAIIPVPANSTAIKQLVWTPTPASLGALQSAYGCLFVQAQVDPIFPDYAGEYYPDNWDANFRLNAQQNLYLVNVAQGTSIVKFAFGVGHNLNSTLTTRVRVEPNLDATQVSTLLQGMHCGGTAPVVGSCAIANAMLVEGIECVVAPEPGSSNSLPARLGNTGLLSNSQADQLATDAPATVHSMSLAPRMLRQAIVHIPIASSAQPNDVFATYVIHETMARRTRLGSAIVAVRIV